MLKKILTAGAATCALASAALADPGKNESGKGGGDKRWEEGRKFDEKRFEAQKKFEEKRWEAQKKFEEKRFEQDKKWAEERNKDREKRFERDKKWAEERAKADEKAFERRKKLAEQRFEDRKKWAEEADKDREKAWERAEKRAERRRERVYEGYERSWEEAYERRARELRLLSEGERFPVNRYSYAPAYLSDRYEDDSDYYYRYDPSGYLYQVDRGDNVVASLIPLLGGAFGVGQALPVSYADPVPLAYQDYYTDSSDQYYRYGDGGIYQVDAQSGIIESIVALLVGQQLGVGSPLPQGYDVYNLPLEYRDQYVDTNEHMYRYADGSIYQVDPTSRLITAVIDALA